MGLSSAELKLNIDLCRDFGLGNPCWSCSQEKGGVAKIITLNHPLPNQSQSGRGEWSRGGSETPIVSPCPGWESAWCEETTSVAGGGDSPSLPICREMSGIWGLPGGATSGGLF